jgi:uncharacterized protein (TIGR00159 family)
MMPLFITMRFLDILDILLVAFLMYNLYKLVKGTIAINIFIGILVILFIWWFVRLLDMNLLSSILGSVIGVGAIALIIVFQQEIRRFLLILGTQDILNRRNPFRKYFKGGGYSTISNETLKEIVKACRKMSQTKTGALIILSLKSELLTYVQSGDEINADVNNRLLESIFFKNSPMHDGAVIIVGERIKAARCVLPIDDNIVLPPHMGLRHRAAISMSMETDTVVIVVSEETGTISYVKGGDMKTEISHETLFAFLIKEFMYNKKQSV